MTTPAKPAKPAATPAPATTPEAPAEGDVLAEVGKQLAAATPPAAETESEDTEATDETEETAEAAETEADAEEAEEEDKTPAAATAAAAKAKEEAEAQAKVSRQLEVIQRERKKANQEIAAKRAELAKEQQEVADLKAAALAFKAAKANALADPAGLMDALGIAEGEREEWLKQAWFSTKSATPEQKAAAAQMKRQRELEAQAKKTADELQAQREQLAKERQEIQQQQVMEQDKGLFRDALPKMATAAPLSVAALKNAPDMTLKALVKRAYALQQERQESGDDPLALEELVAETVKVMEAETLEQLKVFDIDPVKLLKQPAADHAKPVTPTAGKKPTAKTLGNDLAPSTRPKAQPKSRDELIADIEAEIKSGKFAET